MQFIVSLKQVIVIFILMLVGFFCKKVNFIHDITAKDLTNLLLYMVSPCLIINSFLTSFSKSKFKILISALFASVVIFAVSIIISNIVFKKEKDFQQKAVLKYGTVYSNAGFMGIPLVQVFLGSKGVFFSVPFLVIYNLFMWSHGLGLFIKKHHLCFMKQIKSLILNPNIIAAILGILIYMLQIKFVSIIKEPLTYLANINTPLSMLIIGSNLSELSLKEVFNDKKCWQSTFLKNIFIPIVSMIILMFFHFDKIAYMSLIIMISCPIAGVVVLFSILNQFDTKFPIKLMCHSTIMSAVSIPLIIYLANLIIR